MIKHNFSFSTQLSTEAVIKILKEHTLQRSSLVVEKTEKPFIGNIHNEEFRLIGATPMGSVCVVKGKVEQVSKDTIIDIETSIHKIYLILLIVWLVVLTAVIAFFAWKKSSLTAFFSPFIFLLIGYCVFRALLYGLYQRSRDNTISIIRTLIG